MDRNVVHSPEFVQRDDALITHVSTWHHLHHAQALLQILYWAQSLQAGVFNVDTLVELDFLHTRQAICINWHDDNISANFARAKKDSAHK